MRRCYLLQVIATPSASYRLGGFGPVTDQHGERRDLSAAEVADIIIGLPPSYEIQFVREGETADLVPAAHAASQWRPAARRLALAESR